MIDMESVEEITNKLNELNNKNLSKLDFESFKNMVKYDGALPTKEELIVINEYLNNFYDPQDGDNNCIFCEEPPSLSWVLLHGTAIDSHTGLNWRIYHYLIINGEDRKFVKSLQYHPSVYYNI